MLHIWHSFFFLTLMHLSPKTWKETLALKVCIAYASLPPVKSFSESQTQHLTVEKRMLQFICFSVLYLPPPQLDFQSISVPWNSCKHLGDAFGQSVTWWQHPVVLMEHHYVIGSIQTNISIFSSPIQSSFGFSNMKNLQIIGGQWTLLCHWITC